MRLIDPSLSPTTSRINDAITGALTATDTDSYSVSEAGTYTYTFLTGKAVSVTFTNINTGASTLDFDGLGAKDIKKWSSGSLTDVAAGDLTGTVTVRYDGTQFVVESGGSSSSGGGTAAATTFTPAGNISATDVQAAIEELDAEKTDEAYVDAAIAQEVTDRNAAIVSAVAGLMDYRGVYDASGNAYPTTGGSGSAGAILKSDFWIISVAGTLPTGVIVAAGDLLIAKQDAPGSTQANWSVVEYNIGYTPVNRAGDTMSGNLAMGSNKVTGLAAASGNGEAVRYEQVTPAVAAADTAAIAVAAAYTDSVANAAKFITAQYIQQNYI